MPCLISMGSASKTTQSDGQTSDQSDGEALTSCLYVKYMHQLYWQS